MDPPSPGGWRVDTGQRTLQPSGGALTLWPSEGHLTSYAFTGAGEAEATRGIDERMALKTPSFFGKDELSKVASTGGASGIFIPPGDSKLSYSKRRKSGCFAVNQLSYVSYMPPAVISVHFLAHGRIYRSFRAL